MDAEQNTERRCANCDRPLARHYHEARSEFARRSYCDKDCRWEAVRSARPSQPLCECGCGERTPWSPGRGWQKYAKGCYRGPKQKPRHAPWVDDGSGFWDWFAGFLDGEGHFGFIPRTHKRTYHTPVVRIALRADDRSILDEIARRTECGTVAHKTAYASSRPQARWAATSMADCLRLIEILDVHPLRAKKALDYATWRKAVLEKDRKGNTDRLDRLAARLVEDRRWNPDYLKGGDAS